MTAPFKYRRLDKADAAYQDFLATNDIGDFAAQKTAATQLIGQIEAQRYAAEITLQDRRARLVVLDGQLAQISPEVGLYRDVDATATTRLAALRLQREEALAAYFPDTDTVKEIEARISQLEAGIATGRTTTDIISSRVVQEAKVLLKQTDWPISEIAYSLGFAEVAHFSNFFKKHTTLSPIACRV